MFSVHKMHLLNLLLKYLTIRSILLSYWNKIQLNHKATSLPSEIFRETMNSSWIEIMSRNSVELWWECNEGEELIGKTSCNTVMLFLKTDMMIDTCPWTFWMKVDGNLLPLDIKIPTASIYGCIPSWVILFHPWHKHLMILCFSVCPAFTISPRTTLKKNSNNTMAKPEKVRKKATK